MCHFKQKFRYLSHKHMSVYHVHHTHNAECSSYVRVHASVFQRLCFVCHFVGFGKWQNYRWLAVRIYALWLYRFKEPFTKSIGKFRCCKCVNDHTIWCIDFVLVFLFLCVWKNKLFEESHHKFQISSNIHVSPDTQCEMRWIAMHLLQLIVARWKFINIIHMCSP